MNSWFLWTNLAQLHSTAGSSLSHYLKKLLYCAHWYDSVGRTGICCAYEQPSTSRPLYLLNRNSNMADTLFFFYSTERKKNVCNFDLTSGAIQWFMKSTSWMNETGNPHGLKSVGGSAEKECAHLQ